MQHVRFDLFFFFNDTATTEIYTLSLHDALPILGPGADAQVPGDRGFPAALPGKGFERRDRKSTRLNSSHANISYAVFCLKKKKNKEEPCGTTTHLHRWPPHPWLRTSPPISTNRT